MSAMLRTVAMALIAVAVHCVGCAPPQTHEALVYDGGIVTGELIRGKDRYRVVAIERWESEMTRATTIQLADGVQVPLTTVDTEFLLRRGRVMRQRLGGGEGFDLIETPKTFDPAVHYAVIVGPLPYGPFFRFDVIDGKPSTMGAEWVAEFARDGSLLRPGAIFIDRQGERHTLPFTMESAEALWGEPQAIARYRAGNR